MDLVYSQWFSGLGPSPSSDEIVLSFTNDLNTAIDNFFPVKTIRFHPTDKPWITGHIKQLIKERQRAFILVTRICGANIDGWFSWRLKSRKITFIRRKFKT